MKIVVGGRKIGKIWRALKHKETAGVLIRYGVAAALEHSEALRELSCQTVVDIGANRGQFALAARHCFPSARIISFEPLAVPASVFHSVFRNDKNVTLFTSAIGSSNGEVTIHISKRDDSSSLLPIAKRQNELYPGTSEEKTSRVRIGRLRDFVSDDEIQKPALLKIDVQGYELEALKGCEEELRRFDYIYVECSFVELYEGQPMAAEVIEFLYQRRFQFIGVYNVSYDTGGMAIQADFLFRKNALTI